MSSVPRPIGAGAPGFAASQRQSPTADGGLTALVHAPSSPWIVSIVFALCLSLTLVIAAVPSLRFALPWPRARVPIEMLGVAVAAMAAVFAYFRYSLTGARLFLFVSLAFVAIGLNRFVFGVAGGQSGATTELDVYFWTSGRLVMAGLLLLGALPSSRVWRTGARSLRDLFVGSAVVVTIMMLGELFLWANGDRLPGLATSTASDPVTITGWPPGLSITDLLLAFLGAGAFFAAAVLYGRPGPGASAPLLAPALVLAAFAHVHYMLTPTVFNGWVSTGDLLRLEFSIAVMFGLMMEVRRAYRAERDQMQQLALAYAAERERVEELEALDRTRAELLRMTTHELMHPVSALRSWIVTLIRRWDDFDDEHKVEVLHKLDAESQRLRDLAERTPEMAGTEALIFPIAPRTESVLHLVTEATTSVGLDGRLTVDLGGAGTHTVTGTYDEDSSAVHASSNGSDDIAVTLRSTATTLSCSPAVQQVGSNIECTANVTDTETAGTALAPAGTVNFTRNGAAGGSCTLVAESATSSSCSVTYTSTSATVDSIVATYTGSNVHAGSTSEPVFIVFFDPNGGFVTGGGWITSPVGGLPLHA